MRITPWVVVRRALAPIDRVAVGVRGANRSERYATEVELGAVCQAVAPEDLAHTAPAPGRELAVMDTLSAIRPLLDATGLEWGPTGSVGFELATGVPTATPESDLDLVVRVSIGSQNVVPRLTELHRHLHSLSGRVDCQVETTSGAVALAEIVGGQSDIMVRTVEGPHLVPRAVALS